MDEAFLVIFRRDGPLVTVPETVKFDRLKLHSIVVDISGRGGSREKERVVEISAAEIAASTQLIDG